MSLVEGPCVGAVQVSHPVGEVGGRRLEDEVVMVAHEALDVEAPAVPALDAAEDVEEDAAVLTVEHDRRAVAAFRADVIVGPGGEVTARASHTVDGSPVDLPLQPSRGSWHESGAAG